MVDLERVAVQPVLLGVVEVRAGAGTVSTAFWPCRSASPARPGRRLQRDRADGGAVELGRHEAGLRRVARPLYCKRLIEAEYARQDVVLPASVRSSPWKIGSLLISYSWAGGNTLSSPWTKPAAGTGDRVVARGRVERRVLEVEVVAVLLGVRLAAQVARRERRRVREIVAQLDELGLAGVPRAGGQAGVDQAGRLVEVRLRRSGDRPALRDGGGQRPAVDEPAVVDRGVRT